LLKLYGYKHIFFILGNHDYYTIKKREKDLVLILFFDGEYYIQNTTAKWWVFGHIHKTLSYTVGSTHITANPLGYKYENHSAKLASFQIK